MALVLVVGLPVASVLVVAAVVVGDWRVAHVAVADTWVVGFDILVVADTWVVAGTADVVVVGTWAAAVVDRPQPAAGDTLAAVDIVHLVWESLSLIASVVAVVELGRLEWEALLSL